MADYNANIKVNADTRQAESQLKKLESSLDKLSDISARVNLQNAQQQIGRLGTSLRGIGERGAFGALALGAGKATAAIGGLGAKFGVLGTAAASAGATINGALGGVPGVVTDILAQVGHIPDAFGLAAVAAMAFAPQILKASSATVGLGAAVDKALGKQTTEKIASVVDNIGGLNIELKATKASFESLVSGSTLNQLNEHLKDAVKESGAFHSSTEEAVTAAEQLVVVQKEQRREQKAITDLIRQAQGLQPQDVRDTEISRRIALLKSRQIQQKKDIELQNQINAELADYERLAAEVASQTKLWADNLDRIARSSKAGVLGSQSQIQTRLQEFRQNRRSADIAREQSAGLAARERQLAGGQYSLTQVPTRGELFPGGRSETAAPQYRAMLNEQARIQQAAASALERSGRSLIGLQAQSLRTEKDITAAKVQQQSIDERSIQLIREQNKLLMEQYRAEQRIASGTLDPASLRAERTRRVEQGRQNQRRSREMTENVIIGGAFPMLFGAGPGAVLGGAAGGLIPGNPMLSVATSALGAVLDNFGAQATELGKTLQDPIKNFDALKEASLLAGSNQERYIEKLIESGQVAEAQAAIQAEIFKKVSTQGVADLQNLGAANSKLSRAWAEFNLQLQTAIAGPMAGLLSWLASVVNISNEVSRKNAATESFLTALAKDPQKYQAYLRESSAMAAANGGRVNEAAVQSLRERYMPGGVPTGTNLSAASQETIQLEKAKTSELKAQVDLVAAQLSLAGIDVNTNRQAYAIRSKQVALQEYENKLLEIKNSFVGKAFNAERNTLMIREANLSYAAKIRGIDAQVQESAARAAKEAADKRKREYLEQLDIVLQINNAKGELRKIQTDMVTYTKGEAEGLRVQAGFVQEDLENKLIALQIEKDKALANTTSVYNSGLIVKLNEQQVTNAKQLAALERNKLAALANQVDLQEKLTRISEERARGEQLRGLETQAQRLVIETANPFGGPATEQSLLLLDQQTRRTELLGEQTNKIADLTEKLNTAEANYQYKAVEDYTNQIALEQTHQTQLIERLAILDQLEQKQLQQNQLMQQYGNIVTDELSTAMSSAVTAVVNGTGTVQEAFATMFQNIGRAFLDMATRMIAQALVMKVLGILMPGSSGTAAADPLANFNAGALQYRANGGPVTGGSPYIVGERGPELFVPGRSGTIVPNDKMGGGSSTNVVVNVDASGSKVEGNDQQGNQLGRVIAAAVQQEIIKQKRPGGLLV